MLTDPEPSFEHNEHTKKNEKNWKLKSNRYSDTSFYSAETSKIETFLKQRRKNVVPELGQVSGFSINITINKCFSNAVCKRCEAAYQNYQPQL